ncbi:MAG: F0F1 ATP synthase subunit B [Clostridiales bacterium]|nr:F0F1 ATP synthase subunit B [Clostridiales bacterium]
MLTLDWNLLWMIINLIVLYVLVKRFFFKPVLSMIENRQNEIQAQLDHAAEVEKNAEAKKEEYEKACEGAREEANQTINMAREQAEAVRNDILLKAGEEAEAIRQQAKKDVLEEHEKMLSDLRTEVAGLAMEAACKVIGNSVNEEHNREVMNAFLKEKGV